MRRFCLLVVLLVSVCTGVGLAATIPYIEVQPVIVQGSSSDPIIQNDISYAQAIFAQIGLNIEVFSTLFSSTASTTMDLTNTANLASYITDSTWRPFPILTVFYVGSIVNPPAPGLIRGVSYELTSGVQEFYAIGISSIHVNDTLAHEIAHVLTHFNAFWQPNPSPDEAHSSDPNNLLAGGNIRNLPNSFADIGTVDQLKPIQQTAILDSPFVQAPEPAVMVLIGSGFAAIGLLRRRRR
jgi:hypothetical protein